MPFNPTDGDRFIFRGRWYNYDHLTDFINSIRSTDVTVRKNRRDIAEKLEELVLTQFKTTDANIEDDLLLISEYTGDWESKFSTLWEFFGLRGTNKGNVKTKGVSNEDDDRDLSADEIYSFYRTVSQIIKELKGMDYVFTSQSFRERFNQT